MKQTQLIDQRNKVQATRLPIPDIKQPNRSLEELLSTSAIARGQAALATKKVSVGDTRPLPELVKKLRVK